MRVGVRYAPSLIAKLTTNSTTILEGDSVLPDSSRSSVINNNG